MAREDRKKGDQHWAGRAERAELEAAIAAWEKAVEADPGDAAALVSLSRALHLLASTRQAYDEDVQEAELLAYHERGRAYAERALVAQSPELGKRLSEGTPLEDALGLLDKRAVPGLFWYAMNLRDWASAQGFWMVASHSPRLNQLWKTCLALDETYHYGAPHAYLGMFYARAPASGGGSLPKAREHFERAQELAPDYLPTRVQWAEFYAKKKKDDAGFKRELERVCQQPDDVLPELVAETRLAKRRAQQLLSGTDDEGGKKKAARKKR